MSSPAQPTVLPIRLRFADGYQLQASAAIVGANDLLTATHVVYQPQHGGWASELAIVDEHGQATPISGWQVWANPQQVYADPDPTTLTLGESQYDVALIGLNRLLPGTPLHLASDSPAPSGSAFGYPQGQALTEIHTDLQHGQDGYSVYQSSNTELGPGSSGGPLLNEAGQLIGINSAGTPGSATWWADIGPFLPQLTEQMQANDGLLLDTGLNNSTGPRQISSGVSLPALLPTGQETVGGQVPNAVTVGGEFRVNSTSAETPAVTGLSDGGYVVTWESYGQSGIYAQRYASNGSAVGGEFRVNSTSAQTPAITALRDGGYVVTWGSWDQDGSGLGVYAQRYASNGSAVGGEFRVNSYTNSHQSYPAVTALNDGGYVVAWQSDRQDGSLYGIYAQRYASNGGAVGSEFRVNSSTDWTQQNPAITALSDGGYVVTWEMPDGSGLGLYAQRYSSNGNAVGGQFRVSSTAAGDQEKSAVTALSDGGYVVTWQDRGLWNSGNASQDGQDGSGSGIYAQRYASNGSAVGGEFRVNSTTANDQRSPAVTALSDGGYVVTWKSDGQDSSGSGIYAQRYASSGGAVGGEFRVNSTTANGQYNPAVTALSDGGYVVTWESYNQDGWGSGIYAQRFSADTTTATQADAVLYRFAKLNGNYFYTANPVEVQSIQDNYLDMMRFEGYAFNCLSGKGKAVYRYALLDNGGDGGGYFFTADAGEREYAAQHPERFRAEIVEGGVQQPAFYAAADGDTSATPVYRLTNSLGGYLFTASEAEKNAAVSQYGYTYQQVAFKVPTAGTPKGFVLAAAAAENQFANENPTNVNGVITGGGLKYNVMRIGDTSGTASVNWSVAGKGAGVEDFSSALGGTLWFSAGQTSQTIELKFAGDSVTEPDDRFSVNLSNASGGQILVGSMDGKIMDDDKPAYYAFGQTAPWQVLEGNAGSITPMKVEVTRSGNTAAASSVKWNVQPTGSQPAEADDFDGGQFPSGTLSFAAGQTSQILQVPIAGDSDFGNDEDFAVTLQDSDGAVLATINGTIRHDDGVKKKDGQKDESAYDDWLHPSGVAGPDWLGLHGDSGWWG